MPTLAVSQGGELPEITSPLPHLTVRGGKRGKYFGDWVLKRFKDLIEG